MTTAIQKRRQARAIAARQVAKLKAIAQAEYDTGKCDAAEDLTEKDMYDLLDETNGSFCEAADLLKAMLRRFRNWQRQATA